MSSIDNYPNIADQLWDSLTILLAIQISTNINKVSGSLTIPDDSNLMKEREVYNDDDTDIRDEDLMANGDGGGSGSGSGDDDDAEGW